MMAARTALQPPIRPLPHPRPRCTVAVMAREKIDVLDARWRAVAPPATCRALLPEHEWLGDKDLRLHKAGLVPGATWVTRAGLMVEPVDRLPIRRPLLALRGLASMAQRPAAPAASSDLASYDGSTGQIEVIQTGTELRLVEVSGWVDWWFPSVGTYLRFAIPDDRTFALNTHEVHQVERTASGEEVWVEGIEWWMLACAAVIVPAAHPFASDAALVGDALARIDAAASAARSARL